MNSRFSIKGIAETIGVIAIVLSLVFVGLQLRQTHDIAVSEIFAANTGHRIEANIAIVDNADVWAKASSGNALTDEAGADVILTDFAAYLYQNPGILEIWANQQLRLSEARTTISGQENPLSSGVAEVRRRVQALAARDAAETPD